MLIANERARPAVDLPALRATISRLERGAAVAAGVVPLCGPIDRHLPWGGLQRGALHDVLGGTPGAAAGFCAMVLGRAQGTVLWIDLAPDVWPPGVSAFGMDAADLVVITANRPVDALWAFEEALRSPSVSGAVLVVRGRPPDMVASRRLQLAAEAGGGIGLLLMPDLAVLSASTARTRWRVDGSLDSDHRHPVWDLQLLRCAGGRPGSWTVAWDRIGGGLVTTGPAPAGVEG